MGIMDNMRKLNDQARIGKDTERLMIVDHAFSLDLIAECAWFSGPGFDRLCRVRPHSTKTLAIRCSEPRAEKWMSFRCLRQAAVYNRDLVHRPPSFPPRIDPCLASRHSLS